MSETKRYYWLKLQEDFFEDDTIDFIESQENGEKYCLFYLKLCLKALKSEGKLIRYVGNMLIPYDEKGLAKLTRTDVDTVRCALALFDKIGLISRLDTGEIFISQLNEMVGTETDKAKLMRQKRAKEKAIVGNNVTQPLPKCYTEIEIEKEIDIDKELEIEKGHSTTPARNRKSSHFQKPTVQEVNEYIQEQGYSVNAERFFDYYESNGWKVGKWQMQDWRAAVRNWNRMDKERNAQRNAPEKRRAEGHTDADYIRDFEGLDEF